MRAQGTTWSETEEGPPLAQPPGGSGQGRPVTQWQGSLGVAAGRGDGVWADALLAGGPLSGGVAAGNGPGARVGGGGPRPVGQDGRHLFVHDSRASQCY